MKIYHISDTHGFHKSISIPDGIDLIVHSGDASNRRDPYYNEFEVRSFAAWFSNLPVKHKIFVPGNHDTSIESGLLRKDFFENLGIHLIINNELTISGHKIWGSPYTPKFGDWSFMMNENDLNLVWEQIPLDTDILITHGPPKGILDNVISNDDFQIINVGSKTLMNKISKLSLEAHLFGHIHSEELLFKDRDSIQVVNNLVKKIGNTKFSNGACFSYSKRDKLIGNGNIIDV